MRRGTTNHGLLREDQLTITSSTLRLGGKVYQLSNVTRAGVNEHVPPKGGGIAWSVVLGLIGLTGLAQGILPGGASLIMGAAAVLYFTLAKPTTYTLILETNAGTAELISTTNRAFIDDLINAVIRAMEEKNHGFSATFNVHTEQQINGDIFQGNTSCPIVTRPGTANIHQ